LIIDSSSLQIRPRQRKIPNAEVGMETTEGIKGIKYTLSLAQI
jgi:hypothetical protein